MCVQLAACCGQVSASQIPYELDMYGIFAYIWLKFMVNVGKYSSPMEAIWVVTLDNSSSGANIHSELEQVPRHRFPSKST